MIEDLARFLGIESRYTDFYGNAHTVPESSLLALVRAMGYDVNDAIDAANTLQRLQHSAKRLEPVYVVWADAPGSLDLRGGHNASWWLERDSETVRNGTATDRIELGGPLEMGYYRLGIDGDEATVIAAPRTAYVPQVLSERRAWGIAAQLYSLRSNTNWGIGDFGDLRVLMETARGFGAATVAVNPLHELHLTNPASASPYSPNSRLFLNALYIDVPRAAARLGLERALARRSNRTLVQRLRASELIDYPGVAKAKLTALRALHGAFRRSAARHASSFNAFIAEGGPALRSLAIYEAIMEYRKNEDEATYGWLQWPEELRDPAAPAVDEFARAHRRDIEFYQFLQWLADMQLAEAVSTGGKLAIGLYRDLAVGVDANSADVWSDREAYCLGVCVGAPPDPLNPRGQNWALPPLDPQMLRARAYAPYIALLRANMRHAGILRIDHVMGLMRLFCIPSGASAEAGTYVNYRFDEMLGILALESHRNRCAIVGEDLGTVPAGFRERLASMEIFGCRLLYFERNADGSFKAPEHYDACAVASPGTHDVAPLAGFWAGTDVGDRHKLGYFANEQAFEEALDERARARKLLLDILTGRGFMGIDEAAQLEQAQGDAPENLVFCLLVGVYRLLGRSAARLLLVQLEDALLQRESVNTPGTVEEMPNWKRKLSAPVDALHEDPRLRSLFAAVDLARAEAVG